MASTLIAEHCIELLAPLGAVRSRRLFGGWGFYADGLFVALIADDRLYLKTDAETAPRFAAAGGEPFVYSGGGRTVRLGFCTPPAEAMDSPALMEPWARLALAAALRASAAKIRRAAPKPRAAAAASGARRRATTRPRKPPER